MARADTITLLSLDRYAKIMGITPLHFNQATTQDLNPEIFPLAGCNDVWWQYAWQNADRVSRDELARAIDEAEKELTAYLKYSPAPTWITNEVHRYPRPHRPEYIGNGVNNRGFFKSVKAKNTKIISPGRRAVTLIGDSVTVAYSDPDGDGFDELATITTPTSLTDVCELKVYIEDKAGAREWEIRPAKSKVISGGNVTFTFDSWLLIDPDNWEVYPTSEGIETVNVSTTANFVTEVDVYREYTDTSQVSAQFFWERLAVGLNNAICSSCLGSGCQACTLITQDGCLHISDVDLGFVSPVPASYDSDDAIWQSVQWTECREPDQVKLWYYAGDMDEYFLSGDSCDPLSNYWAQTIAYLATARLERSPCSCGNVQALFNDLRTDLTFTGTDSSYFNGDDVNNSVFGTKKGEVYAYRRVSKFDKRVMEGYAI